MRLSTNRYGTRPTGSGRGRCNRRAFVCGECAARGQRPEAWRRCTSSAIVSAAALTLASVFWSGEDCLRRVQALCAAVSSSSLTSPPAPSVVEASRQRDNSLLAASALATDHGGALRHAAAQNERENETRHVVLPNDSHPTPTLAKHPPGPKREMHSRILRIS